MFNEHLFKYWLNTATIDGGHEHKRSSVIIENYLLANQLAACMTSEIIETYIVYIDMQKKASEDKALIEEPFHQPFLNFISKD